MKTLHTINTSNVTVSHASVRLILAIVGIVTAVLCAIALMNDVRAAELFQARIPRLLELPKIMVADFVSHVKI